MSAPAPLRTVQQSVKPTGGKVVCAGCNEAFSTASISYPSTAESRAVAVTLKVYGKGVLASPPGKQVVSLMPETSPAGLRVNARIEVELSFEEGAHNPVMYGLGASGWVALPTQSSPARALLRGSWQNAGAQQYTQFCVAAD